MIVVVYLIVKIVKRYGIGMRSFAVGGALLGAIYLFGSNAAAVLAQLWVVGVVAASVRGAFEATSQWFSGLANNNNGPAAGDEHDVEQQGNNDEVTIPMENLNIFCDNTIL